MATSSSKAGCPRKAWLLLPTAVLGTTLSLPGCTPELSGPPARPHGEVGAEVFRLVCMNLAAQAFPNDLTGERFAGRCAGGSVEPGEATTSPGGEQEQRAYARYLALVARRAQLVQALDAAFDGDAYRPDELRDFLSSMVPLYDPPEQLPEVTRAAATLLTQLVDPKDGVGADAIAALERMSVRDGYREPRFGIGLTRALLGYPRLDEVLRTTLAAIAPNGAARAPFEDLLRATALDLATAERGAPDPLHPGTLTLSAQLLLTEDDAFTASSAPVHLTLRDARGVARPRQLDGAIAAPFQDVDGDGLADIDERGRLVLASGTATTPYPTLQSIGDAAPRDASGRALDATGQPLYQSVDAERTMLAGLLRDAAPLLAGDTDEHAALLDYAYGMNALLGDYGARIHESGAARLSFEGPDTSKGPLFDLVHAIASVLPFDQTGAFLEVVERVMRDHEREVAGLIEAVLYIKERSDAYPDAKWEKPHEFWDDLLAWSLRVAETPGLLEAVLRSATTEEFASLGPVVGNFMRFKDRANWPLGKKEELEALGIGITQVLGKAGEDCESPACGTPCDLTNRCPDGLACAIDDVKSASGVCGSVSEAIQAHRLAVNFPCPPLPDNLLDADEHEECSPQALHPAPYHRGIRGCPADKPVAGASCSDVGGVGLCSWENLSCTCDCAGGLCRHGATPTWRCEEKTTPGFADWVDRGKPDERGSGDDGKGNQSLFQRTVFLVHDLHIPNKMCNKDDAHVVFYNPGTNDLMLGGLNDPLLGIFAPLLDEPFGPYPACELQEEQRIVRYYLRAVLGYGKQKLLPKKLTDVLDMVEGIRPGATDSIINRQIQIRGFNLGSPTPQGIARFVWSPLNAFEQEMYDVVKTRDGFVLAEYHQDVIPAWEMPDPVSGGTIITGVAPLLRALDPNGDEDDGYIDRIAELYSIVHKHWSSRSSTAWTRDCDDSTTPPTCNENTPLFSYQSNGVSYEELIAEATVDADILGRVRDVLLALDEVTAPDGRDGISLFAEAMTNMLIPQNSCLGGDCEAHPLTYRDGRASTTTNTGKPIPQVAPVYLLLDALNAIDARFEGAHEGRLAPWRSARSRIVDVFFDVERSAPGEWRFKNPRGRMFVLEALEFLRERVATYQREQATCLEQGGSSEDCRKVHDWAFGLTPRMEASLGQPVSAATLRLLDRLRELDGAPADKLTSLAEFLATEASGADTFAATLVSTADLLQVLQDTQNVGPLMAFLARAIAGNANDVAAGTADALDVQTSALEKSLALMRSLQDLSPESDTQKSTLASLLARLARPHGAHGEAPLDVILESIVAVNRATPGERDDVPLEATDLRVLLKETEQFLGSERHGLERLYDVVQSRELP